MRKLDCLKRKSTWFAVISIILSISLIVGVTVSYLSAITEDKVNVFVPGDVSCDVVEVFSNNVKSSIKVQNTGNTDSYIRLNLVSYIQNDEGNIVGANAEVPYFEISGDWVLGADGYYYYKYPVKPGAFTGELLAEGETITLQYSEGKAQVIEVFAEAVQANPSDAVMYAWGVENDSVVKSVSDTGVLDVQDGYYKKHTVSKYRGVGNIAVNYGFWGDSLNEIVASGDKSAQQVSTEIFKAWHSTLLTDGVIPTVSSSTDRTKIVEVWKDGISDYIEVQFLLSDITDIKQVDFYVSDRIDGSTANMGYDTTGNRMYPTSMDVLVCEMVDVNGEYIPTNTVSLGTVNQNSATVYQNSTDGYVKKYSVAVEGQFEAVSGNCVVVRFSTGGVIALGEIEIFGYGERVEQVTKQKNVALESQYRGGVGTAANTFQYTDEVYRSGSTGNTWGSYHFGKFNDGHHSTANDYFNDDWVEFAKTESNMNSPLKGYYNLIFKLKQPSDVYKVSMYLHNSGNQARAFPTAVQVYLSDDDAWTESDYLYGTLVWDNSFNNNDYTCKWTVEGTPQTANYVVLRFYNTSNVINAASEIEIWANVTEGA